MARQGMMGVVSPGLAKDDQTSGGPAEIVADLPHLESVDGNAIFVVPDYFQGGGRVYEYSIDIHFEWPRDRAWHGIMGFNSPVANNWMRWYLSKMGDGFNVVQFSATNQYDISLAKSSLSGIAQKDSHDRITCVYDLVNGVATVSSESGGQLGAYEFINTSHVVDGNRPGGILGTIDFASGLSDAISGMAPAIAGSRLYGFTERVDGVLVHDYSPRNDGSLYDSVTGQSLFPAQGEVVYKDYLEVKQDAAEDANRVLRYEMDWEYYEPTATDEVIGTWTGDRDSEIHVTLSEDLGGESIDLVYNEDYGYWECSYSGNGWCNEWSSGVFSLYDYDTGNEIYFGFGE